MNQKKHTYTLEELNYIKNNYGKLKVVEIANQLLLTSEQVQNVASRLGLKSDLSKKHLNEITYKDKDIEYIKEFYDKKSLNEIANDLGRTYRGVSKMIWKLGLVKINKEKIKKERENKNVDLSKHYSSNEFALFINNKRKPLTYLLAKTGLDIDSAKDMVSQLIFEIYNRNLTPKRIEGFAFNYALKYLKYLAAEYRREMNTKYLSLSDNFEPINYDDVDTNSFSKSEIKLIINNKQIKSFDRIIIICLSRFEMNVNEISSFLEIPKYTIYKHLSSIKKVFDKNFY